MRAKSRLGWHVRRPSGLPRTGAAAAKCNLKRDDVAFKICYGRFGEGGGTKGWVIGIIRGYSHDIAYLTFLIDRGVSELDISLIKRSNQTDDPVKFSSSSLTLLSWMTPCASSTHIGDESLQNWNMLNEYDVYFIFICNKYKFLVLLYLVVVCCFALVKFSSSPVISIICEFLACHGT